MERDFPRILASLPAALFRGYADGSVDLFDRKAEALTGFPREEFESRRLRWTDLVVEADRGPRKQALLGALKADGTYTHEYRILTRDGRQAWVHEQSHIVCGADGRIESIDGLFFDITGRKALEESLWKAERDLRIVVGNLPAVTFKGYPDGTVDFFDRKIEALTGYPTGDFSPQGRKWTGLILEEDRGAARSAFLKALHGDRSYIREYRVRTADARPVWIHERSQILCDADGRIECISGLIFDITDRKQLEATVAERTAELQQANERLLSWGQELEHRNAEINLLGRMGDLLQCCNTTAEAYTGIQAFGGKLFPGDFGALYVFGEAPGRLEAAALWGERPPMEREFPPDDCWALRRGRAHGRGEVESGLRCPHVADGAAPYVCIPMVAHGSSLGVLHLQLADRDAAFWDARQRLGTEVAEHLSLALAKLKLQETLQHLSVRDPLTGLFNRRYLEESLERELRSAERKSQPLSLLMVDLDHFKRINDRHGHDAGDAVLKEVGAVLQKETRGGDIVSRYGGEEFTVVLPDMAKPTARRRAEQIRRAVRELRVRHGPGELDPVTLSVGIAAFPEDGRRLETLLQAADAALYKAKKAGRDRICEAEPRAGAAD